MATPAIRVPIIVMDKFTAPIRLFTARVNTMMKPIDEMTKHFNRLHTAVENAFKAVTKPIRFAAAPIMGIGRGIGGAIGGIGRFLGSAAGMVGIAGIGGAISGIVKIAKDTAEFGESLANTSEKLGVTVEGLQMLRHAAKMSDISVEEFDTSILKMTKSIGAAMGSDKKKASLFSVLGIDLAKTKNPEEVFLKIADGISRIKNVNLRNAAIGEIFGKGAANMAIMFKGGRAGIEEYMAARKKMGLMDEEGIKKAQKFDETWKIFTSTLQGLRNSIGIELLPTFGEGLKNLQEALLANKPAIVNFFKELAAQFTPENLSKIKGGIADITEALRAMLIVVKPLVGAVGLITAPWTLANAQKEEQKQLQSTITNGRMSTLGYTGNRLWGNLSAAGALGGTVSTRNTNTNNNAFLKIQVSPDGTYKTSLTGSLGNNVGWSMVP